MKISYHNEGDLLYIRSKLIQNLPNLSNDRHLRNLALLTLLPTKLGSAEYQLFETRHLLASSAAFKIQGKAETELNNRKLL